MNIKTLNGKEIKIEKAQIRISANKRIKEGLYVELELTGTLPRGRKSQTLSYRPSCGKICINNLYGYSSWVDIEPEEFRKFIKTVPVVSCWHSPVILTQELNDYAIKYIEDVCDCPAVTNWNTKTGWYDKKEKGE